MRKTEKTQLVELPLETATSCAHRIGVSRSTILSAMERGDVPVYATTSPGAVRPAFLLRVGDADAVFRPLRRKHDLTILDRVLATTD